MFVKEKPLPEARRKSHHQASANCRMVCGMPFEQCGTNIFQPDGIELVLLIMDVDGKSSRRGFLKNGCHYCS